MRQRLAVNEDQFRKLAYATLIALSLIVLTDAAVRLTDSGLGCHRQIYCPDGFGHGFCVLSELADVTYGCTTYWDPRTEGGFRFDDPEVGIAWPDGLELTPSAKDAAAPTLAELLPRLPFRYEPAAA